MFIYYLILADTDLKLLVNPGKIVTTDFNLLSFFEVPVCITKGTSGELYNFEEKSLFIFLIEGSSSHLKGCTHGEKVI